jgi:hypothetical protein
MSVDFFKQVASNRFARPVSLNTLPPKFSAKVVSVADMTSAVEDAYAMRLVLLDDYRIQFAAKPYLSIYRDIPMNGFIAAKNYCSGLSIKRIVVEDAYLLVDLGFYFLTFSLPYFKFVDSRLNDQKLASRLPGYQKSVAKIVSYISDTSRSAGKVSDFKQLLQRLAQKNYLAAQNLASSLLTNSQFAKGVFFSKAKNLLKELMPALNSLAVEQREERASSTSAIMFGEFFRQINDFSDSQSQNSSIVHVKNSSKINGLAPALTVPLLSNFGACLHAAFKKKQGLSLPAPAIRQLSLISSYLLDDRINKVVNNNNCSNFSGISINVVTDKIVGVVMLHVSIGRIDVQSPQNDLDYTISCKGFFDESIQAFRFPTKSHLPRLADLASVTMNTENITSSFVKDMFYWVVDNLQNNWELSQALTVKYDSLIEQADQLAQAHKSKLEMCTKKVNEYLASGLPQQPHSLSAEQREFRKIRVAQLLEMGEQVVGNGFNVQFEKVKGKRLSLSGEQKIITGQLKDFVQQASINPFTLTVYELIRTLHFLPNFTDFYAELETRGTEMVIDVPGKGKLSSVPGDGILLQGQSKDGLRILESDAFFAGIVGNKNNLTPEVVKYFIVSYMFAKFIKVNDSAMNKVTDANWIFLNEREKNSVQQMLDELFVYGHDDASIADILNDSKSLPFEHIATRHYWAKLCTFFADISPDNLCDNLAFAKDLILAGINVTVPGEAIIPPQATQEQDSGFASPQSPRRRPLAANLNPVRNEQTPTRNMKAIKPGAFRGLRFDDLDDDEGASPDFGMQNNTVTFFPDFPLTKQLADSEINSFQDLIVRANKLISLKHNVIPFLQLWFNKFVQRHEFVMNHHVGQQYGGFDGGTSIQLYKSLFMKTPIFEKNLFQDKVSKLLELNDASFVLLCDQSLNIMGMGMLDDEDYVDNFKRHIKLMTR